MTDKELIARLRDIAVHSYLGRTFVEAAADRIETLIAERDEAWKRAAHAEKMWGEAEVKLAKAEEGFEVIRDRQYYRMGSGITAQVIARATLAEIKGESHEALPDLR